MSKYIDIVKIMRENDTFSIKLDIMIEYNLKKPFIILS